MNDFLTNTKNYTNFQTNLHTNVKKATFAINGYGRIGRCLLRAWCENDDLQNFIIPQQINELANIDDILAISALVKLSNILASSKLSNEVNPFI